MDSKILNISNRESCVAGIQYLAPSSFWQEKVYLAHGLIGFLVQFVCQVALSLC